MACSARTQWSMPASTARRHRPSTAVAVGRAARRCPAVVAAAAPLALVPAAADPAARRVAVEAAAPVALAMRASMPAAPCARSARSSARAPSFKPATAPVSGSRGPLALTDAWPASATHACRERRKRRRVEIAARRLEPASTEPGALTAPAAVKVCARPAQWAASRAAIAARNRARATPAASGRLSAPAAVKVCARPGRSAARRVATATPAPNHRPARPVASGPASAPAPVMERAPPAPR